MISALVEQRRVAVLRCDCSFSRKYGSRLDVIPVDLAELGDVRRLVAVMRRRVEALGDAALRIDAARRVAAHLEREHARDVGLERERLQVEHQLDVLVERVGHAGRRAGQLARLAAHVARLDLLDAPLDLADVLEIALHPLPIARVEPPIEIRHLRR